MKSARLHRRRLLMSLLVVGIAPGARAYDMPWMQFGRVAEPGWLNFDGPPTPSLGLEVEGSHEKNTVSGGTSTYDQLSITPTVGLETKGSVYHPNLCAFNLNGELGWGWDNTQTTASGSTQTQNTSSDVKRYLAQLNFLQEKPYNASFFATQDHTYQNFSSFNTMTVDSTRYGGGVNFFSDTFTLNADAGYWDQKNSGLSGYSEISQNYYNLTAINYRSSGQTTFTARANEYQNTLNNGTAQNSDNYGVGLSDSETFGARKQITAATGVTYSQAQYSGQLFNTVTANENVSVNHSPTLDSYGTVNYNHSDYQPVTDDRVQGQYALKHKLYESLVSSVNVHGYYENNNSGNGNSATYDSYGVGGSEDYTKRLGSWGRLSANLGLVGDHVDNNTVGGVQTTVGEPHTLTLSGPPVYLDSPDVILSTVVVFGPGGVVAQVNVDYLLTQVGSLTQISLIPTSAILHNGDTVHVNYQSASTVSASYDTLTGNAQVRLDFLDHYGIYGRLNWMDNNAPPQVVTQTLTEWIFGADYHWRWLRAGVEYDDYNSSFTTYQAGRSFQNLTFKPSAGSTLGFNFNESVYKYSNSESQTMFQAFSHYNVQLVSSVSWFAEAGYIYQDVLGTAQWTGTARTGMTWTRGKMSVHGGYDFNDQESGSGQYKQQFLRSHFYVYLKRTF
jgi:hypothetical protein